MLTRCILVFLTFLFVSSVCGQPKSPDPFIQSLFDLIQKDQLQKDEKFSEFKYWDKTKGTYPTLLHFNFHGTFPSPQLRWNTQIVDDNIFVAIWITNALLEAYMHGNVPRPSDEQLMLLLDASVKFVDKSKPYNSSVMFFWKQTFNELTQEWTSDAVNLYKFLNVFYNLPLQMLKPAMQLFGRNDFAKFIEYFSTVKVYLKDKFHLTADFDSTFANLALGSLLHRLKDDFPVAAERWKQQNPNITSVFDALKQYAYRPFSEDANSNTINPTAYFYLRKFLDQAKAKGQDVALVPTWIQNLGGQSEKNPISGYFPFFTNGVDVHVCANVIYELTASILSGLVSTDVLEDAKIGQIYENTTSLIDFMIRNNFSGRLDLAMPYYTSKIQFYWLVGKIFNELETAKRRGIVFVKVMEDVYKALRSVLEEVVTKEIISSANQEGDLVYYDDYLGNGDKALDGKTLIRGEDRIFTTAAAANVLLNIWTYFDEGSKTFHWKEGTPENVQKTVKGCVDWLRRYTLEGKYEPWNSLFSNGISGFESLPFSFPGNRNEYINKTRLSDQSKLPNEPFIHGVQGYIPEEQYNKMLQKTHFGYKTPITFSGFNSEFTHVLYGCSVSWTYSTVMLAVSRFSNIA